MYEYIHVKLSLPAAPKNSRCNYALTTIIISFKDYYSIALIIYSSNLFFPLLLINLFPCSKGYGSIVNSVRKIMSSLRSDMSSTSSKIQGKRTTREYLWKTSLSSLITTTNSAEYHGNLQTTFSMRKQDLLTSMHNKLKYLSTFLYLQIMFCHR